jgi:exonuclease SbcC
MRILGIRFQNINSLAGEWQVDFTRPEFTADGIFAITGPTGAGKTTLLDVICLALYGRTPRLERVNKSTNEVMTRQSGECFAEVTFSTQAGKFRCHWSQHRARKKPEGDLQTPKHEISHVDSGQIIDNQIRTVAQRIEATTGMDFERFTQSMMLAQGGFAVFLKATADERAPILEQITGTRIYSDISIKVHERRAHEKNLLETLEQEFSSLQLLTPEQEITLKAEVSTKTKELSELNSLLLAQRQQRDWKHQCLQLEHKISQQHLQREQWQQQQQAFVVKRKQLDNANRALELAGQYSALATLRQSQQDDQQRQTQLAAAQPALQHSVTTQQKNSTQAAASQLEANTQLIQMRPVFKQVHVLDSKVSQQRTQLEQVRAQLSKQVVELDAMQQHTKDMQTKVVQHEQALKIFLQAGETSYQPMLQRLADDGEQKRLALIAKQKEITNLRQDKSPSQWRHHSEQLSQSLSQCETLAQRFTQRDALLAKLQSRQQQLQTLNTGISVLSLEQQQCQALMTAQDVAVTALHQQRVLQQNIKNMESQRAQLSADQPCPLCGALHHPFASHAPDADVAALNSSIYDAEKLLALSREQHQTIHHKLMQQQEQLNNLTSQHEDEHAALIALQSTISAQSTDVGVSTDEGLAQHRDLVQRELNAVKQTLDLIENEQQQLHTLDQATQTAREKLSAIKLDIKSLTHSQELLQSSQQQLDKLSSQKDALHVAISTHQQALDDLLKQRKQLLADHDADEQEAQLETTLANADKTLQNALVQQQQAENQLHDSHQQTESVAQQIRMRMQKIQAIESDFNTVLTGKNFSNEQDYLAAVLPDVERRQLQQQSDKLQQQGTELAALMQQSNAELKLLQQQALSAESLEALQQNLDEQEIQVSQLQETLGGLRRDLHNNAQARDKQKHQAEKIDAQKIELVRWSALHELIGSGDGKKFRNFAQGLTFELMITHANQQLRKMTERYLLLRDKDQPLDLNVIDQYQAGEIRSTKNLSGGESFIVSLALALGLSRMASRNVRVDSLFLDEGFGTLDEDALDTALETLASLQQEGKLIGVISHVNALKERISTQIRVTAGPGGRSTLSGPGCQSRTSADGAG